MKEKQENGNQIEPVKPQNNAYNANKFFRASPKNKRKEKAQVKAIKKEVRKDSKKDLYYRYGLIKRNVDFASGRSEKLKHSKKDFHKIGLERKTLASKIQSTDELKEADKLKTEYKKQGKEEKNSAIKLHSLVMLENIKMTLEGPAGCFKNFKGCFLII